MNRQFAVAISELAKGFRFSVSFRSICRNFFTGMKHKPAPPHRGGFRTRELH